MQTDTCIAALAGLAQPIRLETFRLLVEHEPNGLPAGQVARHFGIPQSTMSMNFAVLLRTGLVTAQRDGRSIVYRASLTRLRALIVFLVQNCCGSNAELCEPLISELLPALRRRAGRDDHRRRQVTSARPNSHSGSAFKERTVKAALQRDNALRRANRRP
jgi:DNA-binding transcriptional ArsR family regulator